MAQIEKQTEIKPTVEPDNQDQQGQAEKGKQMVEAQMEQFMKPDQLKLRKALLKPLKKLENDYGITMELERFQEGIEKAFERNGEHIGVLAAKIDEDPWLVGEIVITRAKEYAISCAEDPVQCASDLQDKAADFVWDFIQKSEKEGFKNFSYDIGQGVGETICNLGTVGIMTLTRAGYANPELKDPNDYPDFFAKTLKPKLEKYLSPESQKQMDLFVAELSEQISFIDLNKLQELFGAMEQFAKDCEKGVASTVATMKTLNRKFLDIAYAKLTEFDPRPIIQDMLNIASHKENKEPKSDLERYEELSGKFYTALAMFSISHDTTSLLKTYFALQDQTQPIPKREDTEGAINELIIFRCEYCKDMSNQDFMDMMAYAKNTGMQIENEDINQLLQLG